MIENCCKMIGNCWKIIGNCWKMIEKELGMDENCNN